MLTLPTVVERAPQPYVAVRVLTTMEGISRHADSLASEVAQWIGTRGETPGTFLMRYNVIDMARELEMEFGFATSRSLQGDERVLSGTLPAGRYASITYTGPYDNLITVNAVLIGWARLLQMPFDMKETPRGDAFAGRFELYGVGPVDEPDPSRWVTEVAIKMAE